MFWWGVFLFFVFVLFVYVGKISLRLPNNNTFDDKQLNRTILLNQQQIHSGRMKNKVQNRNNLNYYHNLYFFSIVVNSIFREVIM